MLLYVYILFISDNVSCKRTKISRRMAMSKSISKKILLFLLIVVASLCFSLSSIASQKAFAAQVGFENTYDTGARVDNEDDI